MERRSRSTTRNRQNAAELSVAATQQPLLLSRDARHASIGRSFPEIPTNSSLLQRVGGDSRTLSPERKPHYGFPKTSPHHTMNKSGSYNVHTHGQPPPIPPPPIPPPSHGLTHAASAMNGGTPPSISNNPVPPPRAPITANSHMHRSSSSKNQVKKTEKSFSNLAARVNSVIPDLTNQQQHYNSDFCKVALLLRCEVA
jgi:hypothetical protein